MAKSVTSDCDHEIISNDNGTFSTVLGIVSTIVVTLIFGSYIYTWNESERNATENYVWRESHEKQLDKRFTEIRDEQRALLSKIDKTSEETNNMLKIILEEQQKQKRR